MNSSPLILRLDKSGQPMDWLTKRDAVCLYVKDSISWSVGEKKLPIYGGYNRSGERTVIDLPSIIATEGEVFYKHFVPPLKNKFLFRRDQNICMYCGKSFDRSHLSRDHVIPRAQGGRDRWSNVATACRKCNLRKGSRTPEQASMQLIAVPFEPNLFEFLYMVNRRILADQMVFLKTGFTPRCRLYH